MIAAAAAIRSQVTPGTPISATRGRDSAAESWTKTMAETARATAGAMVVVRYGKAMVMPPPPLP